MHKVRFLPTVFSLALAAAVSNLADAEESSIQQHAEEFYNNENWEAAGKAYEVLVAENPYKGEHYKRLGDARFHLKQFELSTAAYLRAVELGYNNPNGRPMYYLARNYALQNQPELAVEWMEKAIASNLGLLTEISKDASFEIIKNNEAFRSLVTPLVPDGVSRQDGWRTDLRYLDQRLRKSHANLFEHVDEEEWEAGIELVGRKIPNLEDHQIIVELMRLTAMIGDSHTTIEFPLRSRFAFQLIPVSFYQFKDGLFIRGTTSKYKATLGSRVVAIGNSPTNVAIDNLKSVISRDNEMGVTSFAPTFLSNPDVLHALNIITTRERIQVKIQNAAGNTSTIAFQAEPLSMPLAMSVFGLGTMPGWLDANRNADGPLPLWLKKPSDRF